MNTGDRMIRFTERVGELGPVLIAEGRNMHGDPDPVRITSGEMTDEQRREQALLLIDAAAALLEDDAECEPVFEALHDAIDELAEIDDDPSPWCSGCNAMRREDCRCPPIAENE